MSAKKDNKMTKKFIYAPVLNRLFASIIDSFISIFVFLFVGIPAYIHIRRIFELDRMEAVWFSLIFLPCILWGYYIFMEYKWGFTLGKKMTGLKVITATTEQLSISNAILRTVCKLIPFNSISILVSNNNRGWHDKIAGTIVIRDYYLD
jgi:uncharacterized RDD family membrane protein YckC